MPKYRESHPSPSDILDCADLTHTKLSRAKAINRVSRRSRLRSVVNAQVARVTEHAKFLKQDWLIDMVIEGNLNVRDAIILEARARGMTHQKIADMVSMSRPNVTTRLRDLHEVLNARRIKDALRVSSEMDPMLDAMIERAKNTEDMRGVDAFGKVMEILYPRRGPQTEINIAGGNIHKGDVHQEATVLSSELAKLSPEELKKRIEAKEREFFREPPPEVIDA